MGDRITTYMDCPKCGGKDTFECYEQLTALLKVDSCEKCGYTVNYDVTDDDNILKITKISPN